MSMNFNDQKDFQRNYSFLHFHNWYLQTTDYLQKGKPIYSKHFHFSFELFVRNDFLKKLRFDGKIKSEFYLL